MRDIAAAVGKRCEQAREAHDGPSVARAQATALEEVAQTAACAAKARRQRAGQTPASAARTQCQAGLEKQNALGAPFEPRHETAELARAAASARREQDAHQPNRQSDRRSDERFDQVFGEGRECMCHGDHLTTAQARSNWRARIPAFSRRKCLECVSERAFRSRAILWIEARQSAFG